jgi:hypothetical protein
MSINIDDRRYWATTIQNVVIESGNYLNRSVKNPNHLDNVISNLANNTFHNSRVFIPDFTHYFDLSGNFSTYNFSLFSTSNSTSSSSLKKSKEEEQKDFYTKVFYAAITIILGSAAYAGYQFSKMMQAFHSYNSFSSAVLEIEDKWRGIREDSLERQLQHVMEKHLEIDQLQSDYRFQQVAAGSVILTSSLAMLIGALISAETCVTAGIVGCILGAAGLVASYFFHFDLDEKIKEKYTQLIQMATQALEAITQDNRVIFGPPVRAVLPPAIDEHAPGVIAVPPPPLTLEEIEGQNPVFSNNYMNQTAALYS